MSRLARFRIPLIGLLVAVVLGAGFLLGLSRPKAAERDAVVAETADLETQAQRLQLEIARLEEVRDREAQITAALQRLDGLVPDGVQQPVTLDVFQEAADAAAVEITSLTYEPPAPVEGAPPTGDPDTVLAAAPVTMVVEGGYFQTVDFFRRLETEVPRAVLVENVAIAEGAEGLPSLATTWSGRVFAVIAAPPDPDAAAADSAPAEPAPVESEPVETAPAETAPAPSQEQPS